MTDLLRDPIDRILRLPSWALCLLFMAILVLRHPQGLLHADFWAEDGCVWYADAYNIGWRSLLLQHAGYLQTLSRLVALLAQNFPLHWGPTIFVLCALLVQALPPTMIVSGRMQDVWPNSIGRLCFALIYAALPNSFEVQANLTNTQWHLACVAFLIVIMKPNPNRLWEAAELAALAVTALSGPFGVLLLPIAVWQLLQSRTKLALFRVIVLVACAGVQGWLLFTSMVATRPDVPLGAGLVTLARIMALQIILGALLGIRAMILLSQSWLWRISAVPAAITLVGGFLTLVALRRGRPSVRKGFVWATLILGTALTTPVVSLTEPQWPALTNPGAGNRYFLIPMLVWIGICISLLHDRSRLVRRLAQGLVALLPLGMITDFHYPGTAPTGFAAQALQFEAAPAGIRMVFAVQPPGFIPLVLTKR